MTPEEWWRTPFPYKARICSDLTDAAAEWLADNGYFEWRHWNKIYVFDNYHRFEFRDEETYTLFSLRWL